MSATEVVNGYYESWSNGASAFDESHLRSVLHPDLEFYGPLAGHRTGAEPFIKGVADIARALKSFRMIQRIDGDDQAAALYECELSRPEGTFHFAEFFRVEDGRIRSLNLMYDGTEFRKLAPAPPPSG
jgi:ketosteroid isomerase-like protein